METDAGENKIKAGDTDVQPGQASPSGRGLVRDTVLLVCSNAPAVLVRAFSPSLCLFFFSFPLFCIYLSFFQ